MFSIFSVITINTVMTIKGEPAEFMNSFAEAAFLIGLHLAETPDVIKSAGFGP